jgi:hypothetical protein
MFIYNQLIRNYLWLMVNTQLEIPCLENVQFKHTSADKLIFIAF